MDSPTVATEQRDTRRTSLSVRLACSRFCVVYRRPESVHGSRVQSGGLRVRLCCMERRRPRSLCHVSQTGADASFACRARSLCHVSQTGADASFACRARSLYHVSQTGADASFACRTRSLYHVSQTGADASVSCIADPRACVMYRRHVRADTTVLCHVSQTRERPRRHRDRGNRGASTVGRRRVSQTHTSHRR